MVSGLPALPTHVTRHTGAWAHTDTGGQPYGRLHIRPLLPLRTLRQSTLYTTLQPGVQAQFGAESATALAGLANQAIPRSNTSNRQRPVLAGIRADRAARGEVLSIPGLYATEFTDSKELPSVRVSSPVTGFQILTVPSAALHRPRRGACHPGYTPRCAHVSIHCA